MLLDNLEPLQRKKQ